MAGKTAKLVPIDNGTIDVTPLSLLQVAVAGSKRRSAHEAVRASREMAGKPGVSGLSRSHGEVQTKTAENPQEQAFNA
jgi:hypothetical protein